MNFKLVASQGDAKSCFKLLDRSLICFMTMFFIFVTSPLLPVLRVSLTNDTQPSNWAKLVSNSSFLATRLFIFTWTCSSNWLISSAFLASSNSWSFWICCCMLVSTDTRWSLSFYDCSFTCFSMLLTSFRRSSTLFKAVVISVLCLSKMSPSKSYWCSLCFLMVQWRQTSSSHVSQ